MWLQSHALAFTTPAEKKKKTLWVPEKRGPTDHIKIIVQYIIASMVVYNMV